MKRLSLFLGVVLLALGVLTIGPSSASAGATWVNGYVCEVWIFDEGAGPSIGESAWITMRSNADCTGTFSKFYVQREDMFNYDYEYNQTFDLAVDWLARAAMEGYFVEAYVQEACYIFNWCYDLADYFIIEDKIHIVS